MLASSQLAAQPLGGEFQVNTFIANSQFSNDSAIDAAGNFTIVWESISQDGPDAGVFGQRFHSNGARRGAEFQINTYTIDHQRAARIAVNGAGDFVVVWQSFGQDGDNDGIYGQRFDSDGQKVGQEFRINTTTAGFQSAPDVGIDEAGNFAVVWHGYQPDRRLADISGQRFSSTGARLGVEFMINTYTPNPQQFPRIGMAAAGSFAVVWESSGQDGSGKCVMGRRFDSAADPLGGEFRLNTYTAGDQDRPAIDMDSAGNFITAWASFGQDGSANGVYAQRYDSSGVKVGPEFRVNTYSTDIQEDAAMALDDDGHFVIVWHSLGQDGDSRSIYGQLYNSGGMAVGDEFHVNQYIINSQATPSIVMDPLTANFVAVWQSMLQDGSAYGVYARRYGPGPVPILFCQVRASLLDQTVQLDWDVSTDESLLGYIILREADRTGRETPIQGAGYLSTGARTFIDTRIEAGRSYAYTIGAVCQDGRVVRSRPIGVSIPPWSLALFQNYPNPFNPVTTIEYLLPKPARVCLAVHDIQGQRIVTLHDGLRPAGRQSAVWDGRNAAGITVGSGIYLYRLEAGGRQRVGKMIFLK